MNLSKCGKQWKALSFAGNRWMDFATNDEMGRVDVYSIQNVYNRWVEQAFRPAA
jgi:hypothetical protein